MPYDIKRLLPRHLKIMDLLLLGEKQCDIARDLDLTPQAVCYIVNSEVFQSHLPKRRAEVMAKRADAETPSERKDPVSSLHEAALTAVQAQGELLHSENENVKLRASKDILDRLGVNADRFRKPQCRIIVERG